MLTATHSGAIPSSTAGIEEKIREEERARVARDLHDELGAHLTGLKMAIGQLREGLAGAAGLERLLEQASYAEKLADEAGDAIHDIIDDLCPPILEFGLAEAIEWQSRTFTRQTGIVCRQRCQGPFEQLDEFTAVTLFRILREALNNAAKYAKADHIDISAVLTDDGLTLRIVDDGTGFSPTTVSGNSSGLTNMRRRAGALGGSAIINSTQGEGTSVEVKIPAQA